LPFFSFCDSEYLFTFHRIIDPALRYIEKVRDAEFIPGLRKITNLRLFVTIDELTFYLILLLYIPLIVIIIIIHPPSTADDFCMLLVLIIVPLVCSEIIHTERIRRKDAIPVKMKTQVLLMELDDPEGKAHHQSEEIQG